MRTEISIKPTSSDQARQIAALQMEVNALKKGGGSGDQSASNQRAGGRAGTSQGRKDDTVGNTNSSSRPFGPQSPRTIRARTRWVFCYSCRRWGKHWARECPYKQEEVAGMTHDEVSKTPKSEPFDKYFDNCSSN